MQQDQRQSHRVGTAKLGAVQPLNNLLGSFSALLVSLDWPTFTMIRNNREIHVQ
jgi:hypothetical protein